MSACAAPQSAATGASCSIGNEKSARGKLLNHLRPVDGALSETLQLGGKRALWTIHGHIGNWPTTRPAAIPARMPSVSRMAAASGPLATSADSPRASRASRAVRGATSNAAAHARGSLKKAFGKVRFYGHAAVPADLIDEAWGGREKGTGERILMPQHGAEYPKGYAHCTKSYSLIWN